MQPIYQVGIFLTHVFFDLYIIMLMLRFLLQYFRVNYYHPLTQFIVKSTSFLVVPFRRIIPGFWGIDFATLFVIIGVTLLKGTVFFLLAHKAFTAQNFAFFTLLTLVDLIISLFFYAILIRVIISWALPFSNSPIVSFIYAITEPMLRQVRRIIPPIAGFDLSPFLVSILLISLKILSVGYLYQVGRYLGISI